RSLNAQTTDQQKETKTTKGSQPKLESSFSSLPSVKALCRLFMTRSEGDPIARFLRLIRFSHTVFALPFALGAFVVAANGRPALRTLSLVVICMVLARTAAMLFNRLVDWSLDQRNPRTATRHLLVSKSVASVLLVASCAGFILAAAAINRLTFLLATVALFLIFFYSLTY